MDLTIRPRRLRSSDTLRRMVRETRVSPDSLIYPLFLIEGENIREPIPSLDGQRRYSPDRVCEEIEECMAAGVKRVLLFGIPAHKDACGSSAWDPNGVVQQGIRAIKAKFPDCYVITDVCMCEYTDHGHCGILHDHEVDNDKTLEVLEDRKLKADKNLFDGMNVEVSFNRHLDNVTIVPKAAIMIRNGHHVVFSFNNGIAKQHNVSIRNEAKGLCVVETDDNLDNKTLIITSGHETVTDGGRVVKKN